MEPATEPIDPPPVGMCPHLAAEALQPETIQDPYPMYARLREDAPVAYIPERDLYLVTTYEGVKRVLADPETFSSRDALSSASVFGENPAAKAILREGDGYPRRPTLILTDPPEHKRYREVMQHALDPGPTMRLLIPRIRAIVDDLIDGFEGGGCEFISQFAYPLPMMVISEILSVPSTDLGMLKRWSDDFIAAQAGNIDHDRTVQCARSTVEFEGYFAPRLRHRMREPNGDFLSRLVHAPLGEGEPLTVQELLSLVQQTLVGGNETTTNFLGSTMMLLLGTDGAVERLRAEPDQIPKVLEEVLRYESPLQGLFRRATTDVVIDGTIIPAGARIMVVFGAANRDERIFPDDGFDPSRTNAVTHLAFGRGIHSCLGQTIARREAVIAVETLLRRLHKPRLAAVPPPEHLQLFGFRGLHSLHVEFNQVLPRTI